jgi:hypothetical protein
MEILRLRDNTGGPMAKMQAAVRLDKEQLDRARKALGAETATEAIERAQALATEKAAHDAIARRYSGVGGKKAFGGWRSKPTAGKCVAR